MTVTMPPHYQILRLDADDNKSTPNPETGMKNLRRLFPDAKADDMNFVLFSTSGVHGTYTTIEDIEVEIAKGEERSDLTTLVLHPRIVCLRYGNVAVQTAEDIEFLKRLRASSAAVASTAFS